MEGNGNGNAGWQRFILAARLKFGLEESEVRRILKLKYTTFSTRNWDEMLAHLKAIKTQEVQEAMEALRKQQTARLEQERRQDDEAEREQTAQDLEQERTTKEALYGPAICPLCGSETIPDLGWYGKYTHTPGWRCRNGGILHYLYWRNNRICRKRGWPIPHKELFPEVKEVGDAGYGTSQP